MKTNILTIHDPVSNGIIRLTTQKRGIVLVECKLDGYGFQSIIDKKALEELLKWTTNNN